MRGAFLACGTAFDPEKHYRVEFVTPRMHLAQDLCTLLLELPLSLHVRLSRRGASYVVYLHGEAGVEDFLTALGAPNAAMDVMQARMLKEVRNQVNRQTNFEAANIAKNRLRRSAPHPCAANALRLRRYARKPAARIARACAAAL